jgi:predicted transcriptional regulator
MAKDRQLVFRLDNDLAEILERSAEELERSRAVILCTGMMLFAEIPAAERDAAVRRYLKRRREAEPGKGDAGKKTPKK